MMVAVLEKDCLLRGAHVFDAPSVLS
jgi:hypothetical protein